MMSTFANEAAWIVAEKARPLEVRAGPTPAPNADEVVIKVAYAAVNPTDFKVSKRNPCVNKSAQYVQMQDLAYLPLQYPFVIGADVSGTVVQVGSNVTRFRVGQRVLGHCDSLITGKASNGGFQRYSTCRQRLVSPVPDSLPLANAAVLPLGVDTAATLLFQQLNLPLPSLDPKPLGRTILLWGGSSSVGGNAVQLAAAAGARVITTASKHNFDYVKSLGADAVYDYNDPECINQLKAELKEGDYVADCISSPEAQAACADILSSIGGGMLPIVYFPIDKWPENVKYDISKSSRMLL